MNRIGLTLSGSELKQLQQLSARHVGFSLTEACPLRCRHCLISPVSGSRNNLYLPLELAKSYALQMPELRLRGIRFISFTGGEPLLAVEQLAALSEAAAKNDITCTVVTACHWARDADSALQCIRRLPWIDTWVLSTDIYHIEYVPAENAILAARAALQENRHVQVRMTVPTPLPAKHQHLEIYLRERLPSQVPISVQPVINLGLDPNAAGGDATATVPGWPCIPSGMVIRADGTVSPCCAALISVREQHPFQYPRADQSGIAAAHYTWCTDPLLQLMRAVGFAPLLYWLKELFPDHRLLYECPRHPCQCCIELWGDPGVSSELRARAELPRNRTKIAELTQYLFPETFS
jgi:pyruvate-formate lyase-activating enzyme